MSDIKIIPDNESAYFFQTRGELEDAARSISQSAEVMYKHSAYLYYIARFMVSIYEATISKIPIQVWNEYRSALDHHMRYLTQEDRTDHRQISRMDGHLQRAVLDVCKLFIHRTLDRLEYNIQTDTVELLRMVNTGHFYEQLRSGIDETTEHFAAVKTRDKTLGNERESDNMIISEYLDVTFRAWGLYLLHQRARHDIEVAAATRLNIQNETEAKVKSHEEPWHKKMLDHLAGHALYYGLFGLVTWSAGKFL